MEIELLPSGIEVPSDSSAGDIVWLADQPSPYGESPSYPYHAMLLYHDTPAQTPGAHRYEATLVTGKEGPVGAILLLALIQRRDDMSFEESFRHWDEHIPLAVEIHHKAQRYRQFRFTRKLSSDGPDYLGLAVLDFASPEAMRTGSFRSEDDVAVIAADVEEFVKTTDVMFGSERV